MASNGIKAMSFKSKPTIILLILRYKMCRPITSFWNGNLPQIKLSKGNNDRYCLIIIAYKVVSLFRHQLEKMSHLKKGEWQIFDDFKPTNSGQLYHFNVGNLTTLTTYSFRLQLEYELKNFTWPVESDGVSCKTKGNVPGRPLPPRPTKKIDSSFSFDNLVELYWGPTPTNG